MQVKQYFSLTVCPLTSTSLVRGGGRYVGLFSEFGTSTHDGSERKRLCGSSSVRKCSISIGISIGSVGDKVVVVVIVVVVDMQREREGGEERAKVFSF